MSSIDLIRQQLQPVAWKKPKQVAKVHDDDDFIDETFLQSKENRKSILLSEASAAWGLDRQLVSNLRKEGIESLFPVQTAVIPLLLRNNSSACIQPRDMCVTAPTGSGKTISYVLPVLQYLVNAMKSRYDSGIVPLEPSSNCHRRLVALLILPSRELAQQVYSVACRLSAGMDIAIALSTGQTSFTQEQQMLVGTAALTGPRVRGVLGKHDGLDAVADPLQDVFSNKPLFISPPGSTGVSLVDILVCTPGRLTDHLQLTPGFTLEHLRFMILDEADRLMSNAYQGWVSCIQQALLSKSTSQENLFDGLGNGAANQLSGVGSIDRLFHTVRRPLQRLLFSATLADNPRKLALLGIKTPLLVRASMMRATSSQEVTSATDLEGTQESSDKTEPSEATGNAIAGIGSSGFVLPAKLQEALCFSDTESRAIDLICMLLDACLGTVETDSSHSVPEETTGDLSEKSSIIRGLCSKPGDMVLIFASSVESTHRLCRLIQLVNSFNTHGSSTTGKKRKVLEDTGPASEFFGGCISEVSSNLRATDREDIMRRAKLGEIKILVCSDQLSRGIDLPNIKLVINYDMPSFAKVYVHRAGRTARAGRDGICITMLKTGQVGQFRKMRQTISIASVSDSSTQSQSKNGGKVSKKWKAAESQKTIMEPYYRHALAGLNRVLQMETDGALDVGDSVPSSAL